MHTILGANGIVGEELAKELRTNYTTKIKLVGRNPQKVDAEDVLFVCDLMRKEETIAALKNTDIAYLTVGLPFNSKIWLNDWAIIMENVIAGCKANNCKLVYFDNTYAYAQDSRIQTEETALHAIGDKGIGKKRAVEILLAAIDEKEIEAVICRAPEFYGPGKTKSITNALIFGNLKNNKSPNVLLQDNTMRTLIYTPDASKAMALIANTPDTYGQTWHLPCDDNRKTYKEFIAEVSNQLGRDLAYEILDLAILKTTSFLGGSSDEIQELLPRYTIDNIFESSKFKGRFPDFSVTTYEDGIWSVIDDYGIK